MPNGPLAVFWFKSPRGVRTFGSRLDPVPISVLRMLRQRKKTPRCIVIAGPNGAGKTTFAREFLPLDAGVVHFVNADLIAGGLSPLRPELAVVSAGRLFLARSGHSCQNAFPAWRGCLLRGLQAQRGRASRCDSTVRAQS